MKESGTTGNAIEVKDLHKSFKDLTVLDGISFTVRRGSILALLGPNGAGKTTMVKILSTLILPDSGRARVAGYDVIKEPRMVRSSIGLTGQFAAVDEYLTGEENLQMIGRLYRLSMAETRLRTRQLLEQFDLVAASTRRVKTYSGGMRRRLDLAMSLIASPPIIFLDEPTTGLDPRSRLTMWNMIKKLAERGTTIFLTTQYMEEADVLADNIVVIDNGKIIAEGTANTLKSKIGSDCLEIIIAQESSFEVAQKAVNGVELQADPARRILSITTHRGAGKLKLLLQQLEDARIEVENVSLHRPTLDDVFLQLTGHTVTKERQADPRKMEDNLP